MTNNTTRRPEEGQEGAKEPWSEFVHCDPEVMAGVPVFVGTRIPVANVTASLAQGLSEDQVLRDYPPLTPDHIAAAIAYGAAHPEHPPVRRLGQCHPDWVLLRSGVVRPPASR